MKKLSLFLFGFITACSSTGIFKAPENKTLLTVANEQVMLNEFIYAFNKNRSPDSLVSQADIDEYLDLYINFKLKVAEAKARGMDTTSEFRQEYNSYISQLDNSYLQSNNESDTLVREAFDRMQYEIRASHILFSVNESDSPEDTLAAYNKAMQVLDSLTNGSAFDKLTLEYSNDPSVKQNKGDLDYFTVFQMVYPFETAAYNTTVGEVSKPVRTKFGYHLIKVIDKRPNDGKVKVAHIMIRKSDAAKDKAFNIYDQLMAGADWDQTCQQNSEDAQSASRDGVLVPFSRNQIVSTFAETAFSLMEPGEISEPIQTAYGWHIIKLLEKLPVGDFETNQQQLRAKVRRDSRSQISEQKMVARLAKENSYQENAENVQIVILPENHRYLKGRWLFEEDSLANIKLFNIQDSPYYAKGFYAFINKSAQHKNSKSYLYEQYKKYKEESLIDYEKAHLSEKYEDYKYLKQEYYDGILLFSIMEDEVWARAGKDSIGLVAYYEQHKNDFIDTTKLLAVVFSSNDRKIINSLASEISDANEYKRLSAKEKETLLAQYNGTPQLSLHLDSGEFIIDQHPILEKISLPFKETILNVEDKWYYVISMRDSNLPIPMEFIKGKLIADYQLVLEDRWLTELKNTYTVTINSATLKNVYKDLEKF